MSPALDPGGLSHPAEADLTLPVLQIEPLLRRACSALGADAVTVAVRRDDSEHLLVCGSDGTVREASGSISLGLVANGPTKLSGGAGVLQAAECSSLFGFTPSGYLGAPFRKPRRELRGGVAAWSRDARRWGSADGTLLREIASLCAHQVETARSANEGFGGAAIAVAPRERSRRRLPYRASRGATA